MRRRFLARRFFEPRCTELGSSPAGSESEAEVLSSLSPPVESDEDPSSEVCLFDFFLLDWEGFPLSRLSCLAFLLPLVLLGDLCSLSPGTGTAVGTSGSSVLVGIGVLPSRTSAEFFSWESIPASVGCKQVQRGSR